MFALWMFGKTLENVWGSKRFLIFYMITALGAAAVHLTVSQLEIMSLKQQLSFEEINLVLENGKKILEANQNYTNPIMGKLNLLINTPTVGASGAVFGLLLAFGMLFPNTMIFIFGVIPIKAKFFVIIYGVFELWAGLSTIPQIILHILHIWGV